MNERQKEKMYGRLQKGIDGTIYKEFDQFKGPDPAAVANVVLDVLVMELVCLCTDPNDEDLSWERYNYLRACWFSMQAANQGSSQDGVALQ